MKRKTSESEEKQPKGEYSYVISFGFAEKNIFQHVWEEFTSEFRIISLKDVDMLMYVNVYMDTCCSVCESRCLSEKIEEFSSLPSDKKSSQL